jgi:hypothetical protein
MPNTQPKRCAWVNVDHVLMREHHDREWGVPTHEDRTHFEFPILEAAQAGLSWSIVLNKRDAYRRAFSDGKPCARFPPPRGSPTRSAAISTSAASAPDPAVVRSTNDKCDAIVQERVCLSLLG